MGKRASDNKWRFERKFALTPFEFLQFEKQLMLSDLETLHPDRKINNCYMDDVKYNSYLQSLEGYSEKMKVRIRWYGDLLSKVTPKLEFKIKQNNSNRKELYKLFEVHYHEDFNWIQYVHEVKKYLLEKHRLYLADKFQPVLINSYHRAYFSNFDKSFRLTVDSNLKFMSPDVTLQAWNTHTIDKYIVELKFNNAKILTDFPLLMNLGKFSKFYTGVYLNH
jgi:SPX domain protein involved in polyphosphate accumulation